MSTPITLSFSIPQDIAERVVAAGRVDWGRSEPKPDAEHVADFTRTLAETRSHFGMSGDRELHGLYLAGTDVVLCHTGTSPNGAIHARTLAGLWNALVESVERRQAGIEELRSKGVDDPEATLNAIERGLADIAAGRTRPIQDILHDRRTARP